MRARLLSTQPASETNTSSNVSKFEPESMQVISSLNIVEKLDKQRLHGSLFKHMFMGELDKNFFSYPSVLEEESEFKKIKTSREDIKRYFANVAVNSGRDKINKDLGFNTLWHMSATEIITYFDAIGSSSYKTESGESGFHLMERNTGEMVNIPDNPVLSYDYNLMIIEMIIRNCLVMNTIKSADNHHLKGQMLNLMAANPDIKIAYGWSEKHHSLGATHYSDWISNAELSRDGTHWTVSGEKNCILADDYQHYLLFCKTMNYETNVKYPEGYKRPPGLVAFLVPKEMLPSIEEYTENGVKYQRIKFNNLALDLYSHELLTPDKNGQKALNCKSLGQLAVAAFMLGRIKDLWKTTCDNVFFLERSRYNDVHQVRRAIYDSLVKINALESLIYFNAGLFDAFDDLSEIHVESMITKSAATDMAHAVLDHLQTLYGPSKPLTTVYKDNINLWDGFLEGTIHNKILAGLHGLQLHGGHQNDYIHKINLTPFYPGIQFVDWWRSRNVKADRPSLKLDLKKYLQLTFQFNAEDLELGLEKLRYCTENTLAKFKKVSQDHEKSSDGKQLILSDMIQDSPSAQLDIIRSSEIATQLMLQIAILARGNRVQDLKLEGVLNQSIISRKFCLDSIEVVKQISRQIIDSPYANHDQKRNKIHKRNLKYGGYFAFSPLDKVLY